MLNIRFLTLAATEIDEAIFWYQKHSQDESLNFLAELARAFQVVRNYPFIAAQIESGISVSHCDGFPVL